MDINRPGFAFAERLAADHIDALGVIQISDKRMQRPGDLIASQGAVKLFCPKSVQTSVGAQMVSNSAAASVVERDGCFGPTSGGHACGCSGKPGFSRMSYWVAAFGRHGDVFYDACQSQCAFCANGWHWLGRSPHTAVASGRSANCTGSGPCPNARSGPLAWRLGQSDVSVRHRACHCIGVRWAPRTGLARFVWPART